MSGVQLSTAGESRAVTPLPKRSALMNRYPLGWAAVAALGAVLQVIIARRLQLDPDELDHLHQAFLWSLGLRPFVDFIVEKPPLLSPLLAGMLPLAGYDTLWTYRLPFIVCGVGSSAAVYALTRRMAGRRAALVAVTVLTTTAVFDIVSLSIRPDGLLALLLVLSFLFLHRWHESKLAADCFAAAFFGGLSSIAKLLPLPIVALMAIWIPFRARSRGASRARPWILVGVFGAGVVLSLGVWLALSGTAALSGVGVVVEIWTRIAPAVVAPGTSTFTQYMREAPVFFITATLAALTLLRPQQSDRSGLAVLMALSYLVFWAVIIFKRTSHIQELLIPVTLGSILVSLLLERVLRGSRGTATRVAVVVVVAAFIVEGALSVRAVLAREHEPLQPNTFIIEAQVARCGGNPLAADDFIRCFQERLFWEDHARLSLKQQTEAVRLLNRAIGPGLEAFSSVSLNVFTRNNHSLTPPQVHSLYDRMPVIYRLLAEGAVPNFGRALAAIADRTGRRHVLQPSPQGFDANIYRLLATEHPPAVIHFDAVMIRVYTSTPGLLDFLRKHYRIAYHNASGAFFACHVSLAPVACDLAIRSDTLSAADRSLLAMVRDRAAVPMATLEARVRQTLSRDPQHAEASYILGQIERDRGELASADRHFSTAFAAAGGHDLDAAVGRADVLDRMGQPAAAARSLVPVAKYFRWEEGSWRGVQPWAALFTREPDTIAARFDAVSRKVGRR